jgi:hypothetical protein
MNCVNVDLKINVSEIPYSFVVMVDVVNDNTSLMYTVVSQTYSSFY